MSGTMFRRLSAAEDEVRRLTTIIDAARAALAERLGVSPTDPSGPDSLAELIAFVPTAWRCQLCGRKDGEPNPCIGCEVVREVEIEAAAKGGAP